MRKLRIVKVKKECFESINQNFPKCCFYRTIKRSVEHSHVIKFIWRFFEADICIIYLLNCAHNDDLSSES